MATTHVTVQEAATELNLSVRAVQTRIAKGQLKAEKFGTGRTSPYLIPKTEVERILRERAAERVKPVTA